MRRRNAGKILITGSIAGFYSRQFPRRLQRHQGLSQFLFFCDPRRAAGCRHHGDVLMPGRATETEFFRRADMLDNCVGSGQKDNAADVAKVGFDAMMRGEGDVVSGLHNKVTSAIATGTLAKQHRNQAAPGTGQPH
jgi:uncharacterized protein